MTAALLDGDIIAYRVAAAANTPADGGFGVPEEGAPTFDEQDVRRALAGMVDAWTSKASCSEPLVLLTGAANFRKDVDPTYKSNRAGAPKPAALGFARAVLLETFKARLVEGLEADDLIGLSLTGKYAEGRGVAVTIDKDLRTVPGLHFNPTKDRAVVTVTEREADRLWMLQTLTGDSVDGYGGAPGIGPARAAKALAGKVSLPDMWGAVKATYLVAGQNHVAALRTARLARILRRGDYDKDTGTVLLWHPLEPEYLPLQPKEPTP